MTLLEHNPNAPVAWPGELPVENRYTFGLAGERFFQAIKERGQFLGTRCPQCQRIYCPAAIFCERCFHELDDWIELDPVGEVETYTILSVDEKGKSLSKPMIIAFIRIEDGGIIHRLGEVDANEIFFGMPVEAVLKPLAERQGSILDILYFKPA
jgi:uncharacterized OB-fold protein